MWDQLDSKGVSHQPAAEPSPLLPPGWAEHPAKSPASCATQACQPGLGTGDLARGPPSALSGRSWGAWLCHSAPAPPVIKRLTPNLPSLSVLVSEPYPSSLNSVFLSFSQIWNNLKTNVPLRISFPFPALGRETQNGSQMEIQGLAIQKAASLMGRRHGAPTVVD